MGCSSAAFVTNSLKEPVKENKLNKKTVHAGLIDRIFWDIDGTLAVRVFKEEKEMSKFKSNNDCDFEWFKAKNLLIEFSFPFGESTIHAYCVVFPGAPEFFLYIKNVLETNFSFFSHGLEVGNVPFVEKFLAIALDEKQVPYKHNYIFSRQHCDEVSTCFGTTSILKNLLIGLQPNESLKKTLLIDDNKVSHAGQESNLLYVPGVELADFQSMKDESLFRINHIFYLVGILDEALTLGRENFLVQLKKLQKKALANEKMRWKYCLVGLTLLKEINPNLELFHVDFAVLKTRLAKEEGIMNNLTKASFFAVPLVSTIALGAIVAYTANSYKI